MRPAAPRTARLVARLALLLLLLALLPAALHPTTARAASIEVTTTVDEDGTGSACSLREAIQAANSDTAVGGCPAGSGPDTISFRSGLTGTIALTATLPDITSAITIQGPGASSLTISGGGTQQLLVVNSGAQLSLTGLTLTQGRNVAGLGGAISNNGGTVTITNSTLSANAAQDRGGAIDNAGQATITSSTFGGNQSGPNGGVIQTLAAGNVTQLHNVVFANPSPSCAGPGQLADLGDNIAADASCPFTQPSSRSKTDPLLGPLQHNGGPTQTMALLGGSPAIDAAVNCPPPVTDQRGEPRIAPCDSGAVEGAVAPPVGSFTVTPSATTTPAGAPLQLTVTAITAAGTTDTGYRGTVRFSSTDPAFVPPPDYTFTAADAGEHTFPVTFQTVGSQTVTVTDVMTSARTGTSPPVVVTAASMAAITLGEPTIDGVPAGSPPGPTVTIGSTLTLTLVVTNSGEVPVTDVTVEIPTPGFTWIIGPNLGTLAPDASATGTATLVVSEPGTQEVPITVTAQGPNGQEVSAETTAYYTVVQAPPAITGVAPPSGPTAGNTSVTISGSGFQPGATVRFGDSAATVGPITPVTISVTTPPHAAGAVDVTVTNPDQQVATLTNGFTYLPPAPAITLGVPTVDGAPAGQPPGPTIPAGTMITIAVPVTNSGTVPLSGLAGTSAVGPLACPDLVLAPDQSTTCSVTVTAAAGAQQVAITITAQGTNGQAVSAATTAYYTSGPAAPALTAITPAEGPTEGGTRVTITGSGFQPGATVSFDGLPATDVVVVSATEIQATTPAHAAGPVTVRVQNPDGQTASLPQGFTYLPTAPPPVPPPPQPMTLSVQVWRQIPPLVSENQIEPTIIPVVGGVVEALVGGVVCGRGVTDRQGRVQLIVVADPPTHGCGRPGLVLSFRVNGAAAASDPLTFRGGGQAAVTLILPGPMPPPRR